MDIKTNILLSSNNKTIEFVNGCIIAKDGPNLFNKLGLSDLKINYESVFATRQLLKGEVTDMPITYGFLGNEITFILIKPIYKDTPMGCPITDKYIEYYYEDQPTVIRTLTDVLVLSGDENHRIPQLYLNNPTENDIMIDIMAANIGENLISTIINPIYEEINGLSHNSVRTDQIFSSNLTGSTQFEIYDINNNVQMSIPYNKIDLIELLDNSIILKTQSDKPIKLSFLSTFNALQSLSKMYWVIESTLNRYITSISPSLDTTPPIITFKPHNIPQIMEYENGIVSKNNIIWRFVDNVVDYDDNVEYRDGIINNNNLQLMIINNISGEQIDNIISDGRYNVTFSISDVAGNVQNESKQIIVDETPPTIYYNYDITTINTMDLTGDTQTPSNITKDDIRRFYLDYVWDDIDGVIANSAVTINIQSGVTILDDISEIGQYDIKYEVLDVVGNLASATTILNVTESVAPVILYNDVFVGTDFYMSISGHSDSGTGITYSDIITYAIDSVVDNYDIIIDNTEVVITGINIIPIITVGNIYNMTFSVSDTAGNITEVNRTLHITV